MAPPIIITRQLRRLYALIASLCGTLENNSILLRSCQHFFQQYVMQVRTPPGQPAFGVVVCVYEFFVPGEGLPWFGAAGEDKVCGAHS